MEKDQISVIIPVYKVEPYLRRCVDSVLGQTYQNLEIILVDDGSPDGCPAICDEYAERDGRVKVIHKPNGGLSDARNAGINAACGDWFSFIDSDDWIEPDMYASLMENALRGHAQISVGGVNDEYEKDGVVTVLKTTFDGKERIETLTAAGAIKRYLTGSWSAWDKIYRRELFSDLRYPVGEINEDEAIVLQLLEQCGCIVYTNRVFYHYIHRPGSITTSSFSEKKMAWFYHCRENLRWISERYPQLTAYGLQRLCVSILWSLREIALSDQPQEKLAAVLLLELKARYRAFCKTGLLNFPSRVRLMILRYGSFGLYRKLERRKAGKNDQSIRK